MGSEFKERLKKLVISGPTNDRDILERVGGDDLNQIANTLTSLVDKRSVLVHLFLASKDPQAAIAAVRLQWFCYGLAYSHTYGIPEGIAKLFPVCSV